MPFHFNATTVTVSGGTFTDVARDMHVSNTNHTDSHDVKVNSDNVSSRTYGNITAGAGGRGGDGIGTNGGTGTAGNGAVGGSITLNDGEEASKVGNKKPGIGNISKVAKNAAATRVFQNIKTGTGGKGGEGDTEGGIGGGGGSTKFKLSPGANYEFNDVESGIGGKGGRGKNKGGLGKNKGGQGGMGGNFSVDEEESNYSKCCTA